MQTFLAGALLLMVIIGDGAVTSDAPGRVEPLTLPPCPHCKGSAQVQYSKPEPNTSVFWWYEGYSCPSPCID
jgi:hypothetical protein